MSAELVVALLNVVAAVINLMTALHNSKEPRKPAKHRGSRKR